MHIWFLNYAFNVSFKHFNLATFNILLLLSAISSTGAKKSTSGPSEDTSSPTKKISTSSSINSCLEYDGTDEIFTNPDRVGPLFLRRKMTKKKLTAVVSQRKLFLFKVKFCGN